ncbi:MAG TPA: DNA-binding response regulator, partial [Thauera sp.]|nr:DNA-binding response regulator [Thauera sp.]
MKLRIVLADDHQMFRHALRALLARDNGLEVVAEAASGDEVLAVVARQTIDLICM